MRLSEWRRVTGAAMLWLAAGTVHAQAGNQCPTLPANATVQWHVVEGPDFIFCRAVESSTGQQAFAVSIGSNAPFRPRRNNRVGNRVSIDGHPVYWYEGDVALAPNMLIRETLVELDSGAYAHIIVRASDETELADTLRSVQSLEFSAQRLGRN